MKIALAIPRLLKRWALTSNSSRIVLAVNTAVLLRKTSSIASSSKDLPPSRPRNLIPDLRAGFAYVMAALIAPEESIISGAQFLDRGYEHLVEKLQSIGAKVSREIEIGS